MRVLVETPAGETLGEFITEGYVPAPGDVIVVREGLNGDIASRSGVCGSQSRRP
jgi:hypothetical protein